MRHPLRIQTLLKSIWHGSHLPVATLAEMLQIDGCREREPLKKLCITNVSTGCFVVCCTSLTICHFCLLTVVRENQAELIFIPVLLVAVFIVVLGIILWLHYQSLRKKQQISSESKIEGKNSLVRWPDGFDAKWWHLT